MKKTVLSTLALSTMSFALPAMAGYMDPERLPRPVNPVQTEIGAPGMALKLPLDGSSCDPRVITANLQKLNVAGVLTVTNLTRTEPIVTGQCYALPCPGELQRALEQHCAKAETLAELVKVVEARRR